MRATEADLLDALRQAMKSPGPTVDGMTSAEISAALNLRVVIARELIRAEIAAGRLVPCRVFRPALDGRLASVPGYRLV